MRPRWAGWIASRCSSGLRDAPTTPSLSCSMRTPSPDGAPFSRLPRFRTSGILPCREDRPDVRPARRRGTLPSRVLSAAIQETNELGLDLVVVAGDLTMEGYRSEFEACERFLGELACGHGVVAMGDHDARNVGYRPRISSATGTRSGSCRSTRIARRCRDRLHQA